MIFKSDISPPTLVKIELNKYREVKLLRKIISEYFPSEDVNKILSKEDAEWYLNEVKSRESKKMAHVIQNRSQFTRARIIKKLIKYVLKQIERNTYSDVYTLHKMLNKEDAAWYLNEAKSIKLAYDIINSLDTQDVPKNQKSIEYVMEFMDKEGREAIKLTFDIHNRSKIPREKIIKKLIKHVLRHIDSKTYHEVNILCSLIQKEDANWYLNEVKQIKLACDIIDMVQVSGISKNLKTVEYVLNFIEEKGFEQCTQAIEKLRIENIGQSVPTDMENQKIRNSTVVYELQKVDCLMKELDFNPKFVREETINAEHFEKVSKKRNEQVVPRLHTNKNMKS